MLTGKIHVAAFTRQGVELAQQLAQGLTENGHSLQLWVPERLSGETGFPSMQGGLRQWTEEHFTADALIFVGATGIAVRAIAPFVKDKTTDPAVLCIDEGGRYVIPLLSGHIGGANRLARHAAEILEAQAIITTATDGRGLFSVDEFAVRNDLAISDMKLAKEVAARLLEGLPVGFVSHVPVEGQQPPELMEQAPVGICITQGSEQPFPKTLQLIPRWLVVGIGCRRNTSEQAIAQAVQQTLEQAGLDIRGVCAVSTIDRKADEPGLLALCQGQNWPLRVYTPEQLLEVPGEFTPSAFVSSITGVDNVCERSACAGGGTLLVEKQVQEGVTVAVAQERRRISFAY